MSDDKDRRGYRKKLIEVALPLDAINRESERDKKLSAGHPTTLHYWWAPRPLAACRAVVFAALVDDPSEHPQQFPDEASQDAERERLFKLMRELVLWESRSDARVLEAARREIDKSSSGSPPRLFDPFCGRGLIPLEAQRLGLDVIASDLNPVPVLIAKTLIEIVPRFLSQPAVNPQDRGKNLLESGVAAGFAADVEYYAEEVLNRVRGALEHYYPTYEITSELASSRSDLKPFMGKKLTLMGWLWARTARCSNPACGRTIPLVGSFWLSQKSGRKWWLDPVVEQATGRLAFHIRHGSGSAPTPTKRPGTGGTFRCLACGEDSDDSHIEAEGKAGRIGKTLIACIADGGRSHGRVYLPATAEQEQIALSVTPSWRPDMPIPDYSQAMPTCKHGVTTWADMFTDRQIFTLDSLADQVRAIHATVRQDAIHAGLHDDGDGLEQGGNGASAYADSIVTFLALVLGKQANRSCAFNFWDSGYEKIQQPFAQQGIQKTWDFVESNLFSDSSGSWSKSVEFPVKAIGTLYRNIRPGVVTQQKVLDARRVGSPVMVVTDPPYYDNMGYADLADFFYIWERRALREVYPNMFSTVLTPKTEELAAVRHRFGGDRRAAEKFFVDGFQAAFKELAAIQRDDYPLCLFYAYKQRESRPGEVEVSTGWETMLRGLIDADLQVTGTWPVLSESVDTIKKGKSSLSTSVVLVCRKRPPSAPVCTRGEFVRFLKAELPQALRRLQESNIAPVDLAQAAIGPGMAVYSRYSKVVDTRGEKVPVREALGLINEVLDEVLAQQEGDFDPDTRWAVTWFEQVGFAAGDYGLGESLSKAKNTSIQGLKDAGILDRKAPGGKVRLLKPSELQANWDPGSDGRLSTWEAAHHLIRVLEAGGESAAAELVMKLGTKAETARELAYRLYKISDDKKRAAEALSYNGLVQSWPEITRLTREGRKGNAQQAQLFEQE